MLAVKSFDFNGKNIEQRNDGFINLTQMCNVNGKKLQKWTSLKNTIEFIDELQSQYPEARVVQTRQGAQDGTWGHPNVARKLAAWISPAFSIWCDIHMFNLMSPVKTNSSSPFDGIRHVDEAGNEWWSARELMPLLGYGRWENFVDAIDKAKISMLITGLTVENHIRDVTNVVKRPQGGGSDTLDYKLSRRACYLVAMNGDPRKPEIAAAQAYFVVKTREAEVSDDLERLKLQVQLASLESSKNQTELQLLQFRHIVTTTCPEPVQQKILGYQTIETVEYRDRIIAEDRLLNDGNSVTKTELCRRYGYLTKSGAPDYQRLNKRLKDMNLPSEAWELRARIQDTQEFRREYLPELDRMMTNGDQMWLGE